MAQVQGEALRPTLRTAELGTRLNWPDRCARWSKVDLGGWDGTVANAILSSESKVDLVGLTRVLAKPTEAV